MSSKPIILCVEDNVRNRTLLRRILQHQGYEIQEAENANQALETLEDLVPDLILMDINMPDIDGFSLTQQLRKKPKFANIPIIAITANVMKGDRERTLEAGCDGYLEKPINIEKLTSQLSLFLNDNRKNDD
ncbi:MAG: Polar-differentiation response regulator DivK [Chloroflexi bacterium]|nr:Polar-differentiation response regulator DivK [Chloroflexota bacterium]